MNDQARPTLLTPRVRRLDEAVRAAPRTVCAERARLVTEYFRRRADPDAPMVVEKARALAYLLTRKTVRIYPDERLVGCFSAHRVGGAIYPELHGVAMLEDLLAFDRRAVNRFELSAVDRRVLIREVLPYWIGRFVALRAKPFPRNLRLVAEQVDGSRYIINETGGIAHFVPDYGRLLAEGTEGIRARAVERRAAVPDGTPEADFLDAVGIACQGLEAFAAGYAAAARRDAANEADTVRRGELLSIAAVCDAVPRRPAQSLHEALQSILFAQIALNLESLDNGISPGRLDQLLAPWAPTELVDNSVGRVEVAELLGCFAVKLCEIVPAFSGRITRVHGGLFNGQVVVVGGQDREGHDATNALSHLIVDLMGELRTRQPNYHARLHKRSPPAFRERIARVLSEGAASPALYNDDVIVPMLEGRGVLPGDARDYATIGCVEPAPAGKALYSTDAALFNLGRCLERALREGRGGARPWRSAPATVAAAACRSIDDVLDLLRTQVDHGVARLLDDLQAIELANARLHPTPLSSALIAGCVEAARDATAGGARYNASGIQGVGLIDVGDSLAAIEEVVFRQQAASMSELVAACASNFLEAPTLRGLLLKAPKYGNDLPAADALVVRVMEIFADALGRRANTRGGPYVAGYYSVTAHVSFGATVGALPSGRLAGEPFTSGISAASGRDRHGPTALLRSAASLPAALAPNGVNLNVKLAPWLLDGPDGHRRLEWLVAGGFAAGCMQTQVNVLDPAVLIEARDHPGRYPGLLVRVSGYSAYFDDLDPVVQQEIIDRTLCERA